MPELILDGVRVLELADGIAGSYCGKLLADLGADVIKAERPGGDVTRARGPFPGGEPHPERSGFFLYLNGGKRGITLDLDDGSDRASLVDLAARVDVVIESFAPGELARRGLGYGALRAGNPRLVLLSLTPFGQHGLHAHWRGNDMISFHSSGWAYGFPSHEVESLDLPPSNAPSHGGGLLAGQVAAASVMHGLLVAQSEGHGVHLDLSLQEAMGADNQPHFNAVERVGEFTRVVASTPGSAVVSLLPCTDGWVAVSAREDHQWASWVEVMGYPDWADDRRFADRVGRDRAWPELYPLLADWSGERSKREVFEAAQKARVPCFPLSTARDLLASPQLAAREFFRAVDCPGVEGAVVPGTPYELDGGGRPPARPAPRLGQHNHEVLDRPARPSARAGTAAPAPGGGAGTDRPALRPLAGVRVVDFSWVMAGPICTKYLAALGAEVIKIESRSRPDLCRRDASWEALNTGKRSLTLNLRHEPARELARRLISMSDVVTENFATGVMDRLGLGYETVRRDNPRLVFASSSSLGRTGPERDRVAYGTLIQCFTGWATLAAHPGRAPRSPGCPWTDPLSAGMETFLLLAAIRRQRDRGEGCFIDLSMVETTIAALPEPILSETLAHEATQPRGNRDPLCAPQGCYPAAGDDAWLALSVEGDDEWRSLCEVMGRDDLLSDPELGTRQGRQGNHDRVDAAIAAWTRARPAGETSARLQAVGVAATPTTNPAHLAADDHLAARGFFGPVEALAGGTRMAPRIPWVVDRARPDQLGRPPDLGADNDYVLKELLGLDDDDVGRFVAEEIVY